MAPIDNPIKSSGYSLNTSGVMSHDGKVIGEGKQAEAGTSTVLKGDDDEVARLVKLEAQPSEDEQKSSSRQASTTAARSANAPIIDQLKLARDRITMFQTDVFLHRATQQSWELVKEAVLEVFEMMDRFNGDGHDEVLALIIDTDRLIKPVKPAF